MGRRSRRIVRDGVGPAPVLCGVAVTLLAALLALDPGRSGDAARELGGALALAVLVLAASRGAAAARRAASCSRGAALALFGRSALRSGTELLVALVFAGPALAFAWELGAEPSALASAAGAAALAAACGTTFGFLAGGAGLSAGSAALSAIVVAGVLLWPASLGWGTGAAARFPAPEGHPLLVAAVLLTTLALIAAVLPLRRRSAG